MLQKTKINKYLGYREITQAKLAEMISETSDKQITKSNLNYHFTKKSDISPELFTKILDVLDISEADLNTFITRNEEIDLQKAQIAHEKYGLIKTVDLLKIKNKEGLGIDDKIALPAFNVNAEQFLVPVNDDAMQPELARADFVMVDTKESISDDDRVFVVLKNGKSMVRIYKVHTNDIVKLESLNSEKSPTLHLPIGDIDIQYRVIASFKAYYY